MWERLSKHFVLFCICLVILFLFIFPYCIMRIGSSLTVNRYLKREFNLLNNEINIKYVGNNAHANIKGIHGDRHRWWISAYECTVPFMDKTFEIWIDKRNYTIFGTDFYEVLIYDKKFHHLYSEWVKKQVGIDDENVEFGFAGNFDDPYIDFDKITTLSEDYREVFENTHNLYCNKCYINNLFELNEENAKVIADELRNKYLFNASKITGMPQEKKISGHIYMSTNAFNSGAGSDFAFIFDLHNFSSELNIF